MLHRLLRWTLLITGSLLLGLGVTYGGATGYFSWREQQQPSTRRVLQLPDGKQIPLVQPDTGAAQAPLTMVAEQPDPAAPQPAVAEQAPAQVPQPLTALLPPERIMLPSLGLDWPVVLGDNENLPRFRGVGWLLGSGFPGRPGNMVLFGHLGGPYATFERLHELQPGDLFSVATADEVFSYRVRELFETSPDNVAVLAPSATPTVTLITCSGPWDPVAQTNERRLIVLGELVN